MPVDAVLEVEVNAEFGTQTLNERQVAFGVLHAIFAVWVFTAQLELEGVGEDAMVLENLRDDHRHAHFLENPLIDAPAQVAQTGHQTDLIARQAIAAIALPHAKNLAVHTRAPAIETQKRHTVKKVFELAVRPFADQLQVKTVRLADSLFAGEFEHRKFIVKVIDGQREARLISRSGHPVCLCRRERAILHERQEV